MPMPHEGAKETKADEQCRAEHGLPLFKYLRRELNRGRADTELAREFLVNRHTIRAWRKSFGLERRQVVRSIHTRERTQGQ